MTTVKSGYFSTQSDSNSHSDRQTMARQSGVSSSHFLKLMEEKGNVGFWASEFATNALTVSEGLRRLMAMPDAPDAGYADLVRLMHPDDRASNENMQALIRAGQPVNREFRIIRPDGTLRWIRNIAEIIIGNDGVPIRAVGLCMDVTDRYEASRSVTEGWRSYKTLTSAIASIEWRNLPNGHVFLREGYSNLIGDFYGATEWLNNIHPDDREKASANWVESLATGSVYSSTLRVMCLDGKYRLFLSRAAPILDDMGGIREWLGVLIPVDDLNPAEPDTKDQTSEATIEAEMLESSLVRAARVYLQWSVEDLALRAGVSVSTVRRIEGDEIKTIRLRHLQAVLEAFHKAGVAFASGPGSQRSITFHTPYL